MAATVSPAEALAALRRLGAARAALLPLAQSVKVVAGELIRPLPKGYTEASEEFTAAYYAVQNLADASVTEAAPASAFRSRLRRVPSRRRWPLPKGI